MPVEPARTNKLATTIVLDGLSFFPALAQSPQTRPKSGKCENSAQKWPDYVKSAVCTREKAIVPLSVSS